MSALAWMQSTGVGVGLIPEGGLELDGLEHLDDELYARVLEVARAHKAEIIAELRDDTKRTPSRARKEEFSGPVKKGEFEGREEFSDAVKRGEPAQVPADATPLEALVRFERDPRGVVSWLAAQPAGQERSPDVRRRLQECVRAEARLRVKEAEE